MEPELLQEIERLVAHGDTLAGAEMLLSTMVASVRDAPDCSTARRACDAAHLFCHRVMLHGTAVPRGDAASWGTAERDDASPAAALHRSLAEAGFNRPCSDGVMDVSAVDELEVATRVAIQHALSKGDDGNTATIPSEAACSAQHPHLHAADPRELMTAIFTVVHARCAPHEDDVFEDSTDLLSSSQDAPNAGRACSWNASLVAVPTLCTLMQQALGALLHQAWRRSEQRSGATSTSIVVVLQQALAAVVAWVPQVLQALRLCLSLASQQDGDVQYVDLDDKQRVPSDSDDGGHCDSDRNHPNALQSTYSTYVTPDVIAQTMFEQGGLAEASLSLLLECSRLIEAQAWCARRLQSSAACDTINIQELFTTMCALRLALVSSLGASSTSPVHDVWCTFDSLDAMVSACEALDVASRKAHRPHGVGAPGGKRFACSHSHGDETAPPPTLESCGSSVSTANWPPLDKRLAEVQTSVLRVCAMPGPTTRGGPVKHGDVHETSYFFRAAASLWDVHATRSGDWAARRGFDVLCRTIASYDGSVGPLPSLLALYMAWAAAAAHTVGQGFDAAGGAETNPHRPSAIVRRLRDAALHVPTSCGASEMTEADERLVVTQRMQRCTALEDVLTPCMLVSDSEEDDVDDDGIANVVDDGPDASSGTSGGCCLPHEGVMGASLVCGALLMTLDLLSKVGDGDSGPTNGVVLLLDGFVSTTHLAEVSCVCPVRFLLRSKSLAAQSLGLRLWRTFLARVPKYNLDLPGEVLLTTMGAAAAQDRLGDDGNNNEHSLEHSGDAVAVVGSRTVEALDLLLPIDHEQQSASSKGSVFRTHRFARHYYALQDLVSIVVVNPSASHRLAAKHLVQAALQWYVAPIRCKLLCHLIYTSPYGAIACALLVLLKAEVLEAYQSSCPSSPVGADNSVGCFLNVAVLEHIYGMLRKWTRMTIAPGGLCGGGAVPTGFAVVGGRQSEYVECTAVALNLVLSMLREEVRRATAYPAKEGGALRSLLFPLVHVAGRPRIAVAPHLPGAARMQSSSAFVALLQENVLQPWKRVCGDVLGAESAATAPSPMSIMDAFSINGLVDGITQLLA